MNEWKRFIFFLYENFDNYEGNKKIEILNINTSDQNEKSF